MELVAALAAWAAAIIAGFYTAATRRLVRAQTSPCVILYVSPDESRKTVIQLVAKNIGTAMAYDVRFQFSDPLPGRAWGMDLNTASTADPLSSGPLIDGIPALAPGETRRIDWGQYFGLKKNLGEKHIEATCFFTDGKTAMPSTRAVLEVDSFAGTPAVDTEAGLVVRHLEAIAKSLRRLDSTKPLKVEVVQAAKDDDDAAP